jgi:hypothetical protein
MQAIGFGALTLHSWPSIAMGLHICGFNQLWTKNTEEKLCLY